VVIHLEKIQGVAITPTVKIQSLRDHAKNNHNKDYVRLEWRKDAMLTF
jgi:hypothetical protein